MFSSWSFGRRIGAGFALVVLLALAIAVLAVRSLDTVARDYGSVQDRSELVHTTVRDLLLASSNKSRAIRSFLLTGDEADIRRAVQARTSFAEQLGAFRGFTEDPAVLAILDRVEGAEAAHQRAADGLIRMRREERDLDTLAQRLEREVEAPRMELEQSLQQLVGVVRAKLEAQREDVIEEAVRARALLTGIAAAVLIATVLLAWLLTRTLTSQVAAAVTHLQASSTQLQSSARQQATGANEQAAATTEVTTTMKELLATSRQIADSAQRVAKIADEAVTAAHGGDDAVRGAGEGLAGIQRQVDQIVAHMLELGRKSQQIGGILDIINELADQTNILAINATIESVGAGESGRRFAVVAEEIRKLADRVSGSSREIRTLVDEMRGSANTTTMATEEGSKAVSAGTRQFKDVAQAFARIAGGLGTTAEAVREIELSTRQQSTAVEQVNLAIGNVAQAAKEGESSARQTLDVAQQLATLSRELGRIIQAGSAG
jgi:methyl-accepting chemotaxis protein